MNKQAKFTGYFKLVDAEPTPAQIADNVTFDSLSVGNITGWYSNIVTGSGNRTSRYTEYNLMDSDVEVSRALDIIAEEMTNGTRDELLLIHAEDGELTESEQNTVNIALRRWIKMTGLNTKLFFIARNLIKYGDVVFKRPKPFSKWEHLPMQQVSGAYVDQNDAQNVIGLVVNQNHKGVNQGQPTSMKQQELSVEPLANLIWFTLNNDMSTSAPFGLSVLSAVYKAYQQKKLIEDAIIIYRVQRAPERRVFYIDVGRMPPQRRKAYMDQIKLEMRQRKVPALNSVDNSATVDNIYDPQDMMEDFYVATGSEGKGSKIEVLPGGQNLGDLSDLDYFSNKLFEGLRVPQNWHRADSPAVISDGRLGSAFIQELRFSKFVERHQLAMEQTLDAEFKRFLKNVGVKIDDSKFEVRLPEPSNFGAYRQAEKDGALLGLLSQTTTVPYLSPRFALKRFLQLTENEVIENQRMLREEKNIKENDPLLIPKLYQAEGADGLGGGGGGGFGGGGVGDFGLEPDANADFDEGGGETPAEDLNVNTPDAGAEEAPTPPDRKI